MRFRFANCATRCLFASMIAMTAAQVRAAVVPPVVDGTDVPPKPPVHHHRKPSHEAQEEGQKWDSAPAKGGAARSPVVPPSRPDPKTRAAQPPVVLPPSPKPPADKAAADAAAKDAAAKDNAEPPPKIPRFAALKTDETNMRKGPGQRYPIEWVYQRRDLPMEVEREYDVWRLVRDPDGVEGWVHQVTLSDRRTFVVQGKDATLRAEASETAAPVALLRSGVIGRLRECDLGSNWCQVQAGGYKGFLRRDQIWGLLPDEVLSPS